MASDDRIAQLDFLIPLFDAFAPMVDEPGGSIAKMQDLDPGSSLAEDDKRLEGWWVSTLIYQSLTTASDHAWTLKKFVSTGVVGLNAPWSLLRATLETTATAAWLLCPPSRPTRLERALRVWHFDYWERAKWQRELGDLQGATKAENRRADFRARATALGLDQSKVALGLSYGAIIEQAATERGMDGAKVKSHWREGSGFAHGRAWAFMHLSQPWGVQPLAGRRGAQMELALDEERLRPLAEDCAKLAARTLQMLTARASR